MNPPAANIHHELQAIRKTDLSKLIAHADIENGKIPLYSNHIRCTSTANELLLDFFRAGPDPLDTSKIKLAFLQRIIVPITTAPELANAIIQSTASLEEAIKNYQDQLSPINVPE